MSLPPWFVAHETHLKLILLVALRQAKCDNRGLHFLQLFASTPLAQIVLVKMFVLAGCERRHQKEI